MAQAEASPWDQIKSWFSKEEVASPPMIRVLIADDLQQAQLEVRGRYSIYDPNTGSHISSRFYGKAMPLNTMTHGLKWGEEFPGVYQLQFIPLDPMTVFTVDGIDYRGILYVYDAGGTVSIVNEVDVEDFLHCTLPLTIIDNLLSREAMAALTIAARTHIVYQTKHPHNMYWTATAEQLGFRGCAVPHTEQIDEAIEGTHHMVMSTSGPFDGEMALFPSAWGPVSYAPSASDTQIQGQITLEQAQDMAERGAHAAQILSKAFPGTSILLTYAKG
jgi:stage II sporulation protein D